MRPMIGLNGLNGRRFSSFRPRFVDRAGLDVYDLK